MPVVEARKLFRVLLLPQLCRAGCKPGVVTVMGADDLDLIHSHIPVALSQNTTAEENYGHQAGERHHEGLYGRTDRRHGGSSLSLVCRGFSIQATSPHAGRDTGARRGSRGAEAKRSALPPLAVGAEERRK